jgi:hypothetical protein
VIRAIKEELSQIRRQVSIFDRNSKFFIKNDEDLILQQMEKLDELLGWYPYQHSLNTPLFVNPAIPLKNTPKISLRLEFAC